jgi:hypothetical protein
VKEWKKIFQANGFQKHAGVVMLISDKVDIKLKLLRIDKDNFILKQREQSNKRNNNS